jgi:hypothetical protein
MDGKVLRAIVQSALLPLLAKCVDVEHAISHLESACVKQDGEGFLVRKLAVPWLTDSNAAMYEEQMTPLNLFATEIMGSVSVSAQCLFLLFNWTRPSLDGKQLIQLFITQEDGEWRANTITATSV